MKDIILASGIASRIASGNAGGKAGKQGSCIARASGIRLRTPVFRQEACIP